jgi:uncharacterized protein (DUF1330 family)
MRIPYKIVLAMFASFAFGTTLSGLRADTKPGAYVIVDISEVTDPALNKTLIPKVIPATSAYGQLLTTTENVVALDGTPPRRIALIAFDNLDKVREWYKSPLQEEINAIRQKSSKGRVFAVDARPPQ